ncbi:Uncharacterised protein [Vibrio cholerae]|nr:Uncharacterised protein [Vibrio cholerae]
MARDEARSHQHKNRDKGRRLVQNRSRFEQISAPIFGLLKAALRPQNSLQTSENERLLPSLSPNHNRSSIAVNVDYLRNSHHLTSEYSQGSMR